MEARGFAPLGYPVDRRTRHYTAPMIYSDRPSAGVVVNSLEDLTFQTKRTDLMPKRKGGGKRC